MREKKKQTSHKELSGEAAEFCASLDSMLPAGCRPLWEALEKCKEPLDQKAPEERGDSESVLEFEKEKNDCLQELLAIAIDQYQRVSADYANFQKRVPKQISDTTVYEKEKVIRTLLPALDNFERTLQNAHSAENADAFVKGVQIIYDQMLDILKSHGVEQIEATGEEFDPALHEAMMRRTEPDKEDNIVLEEFQKGYKLNSRVLRPSKVIVNKIEPERAAQQQDETSRQDRGDGLDAAGGLEPTNTE
ncbi:MAG: nucleotide exchange factor GrpE [Phycisphaerales bacterium]|nr:MAG: nucleotide exchange factor GrpE [Phycisphaerales bacterium]